MSSNNDENGCLVMIGILLVCVFLMGGCGVNWYRAGVQSEVYHRAGIEVSQWECFIGAKPAERAVILK